MNVQKGLFKHVKHLKGMRKIKSHGLVVGTVEEPCLIIDCKNSIIQGT